MTDDPAEACAIINAYVGERRAHADATATATKPIDRSDVERPAKLDQAES